MATFVQETLLGQFLANTPTSLDDVPASTRAGYHRILLENQGYFPARVWVWKMPSSTAPTLISMDLRVDGDVNLIRSDSDANALAQAYPVPTRQRINLIDGSATLIKTAGYLYAMTDYAKYGLATASVLTTSEIVSTAGSSTYTSTTCIDTALNLTASSANGDCVGRRVENGNVYGIVTSNTGGAGTSTLTMSGGWIDKRTGLVGTTPTNATAFTITASLRNVADAASAVPANNIAGHLMNCGGKTLRLAGNNLSIATYGTTYQGVAGGWSGGTNPGNSLAWQIDSLVRAALDWVEES